GLPFNTRFGNGDAIGADVVQLINEVYAANTAREQWQAGDLMLVDNVRTAHARERFEGPREVLVAMADAVHLTGCSPTIEGSGGPHDVRPRQVHPDALAYRDPSRRPLVSPDSHGRPEAPRGSASELDGILRGTLGRRHLGRRNQRLHRAHVARLRRPSTHGS